MDGGASLERCERGVWPEIEDSGCPGDFLGSAYQVMFSPNLRLSKRFD